MKKKIYIVGAGPGDPDLITIKGARILKEADIIIYAGSLVPPAVLTHARKDAQMHDSAELNLEEIVEIIKAGCDSGKNVVRLHSGDPSIYGAILEQMIALEEEGIECEIIPGVSSFLAASAALKTELTVPGATQTVILTRIAGRTPVPEKENIKSLASHNATMVIFLSSHMSKEVQKELLEEYEEDTPVSVVYNASRPDQKIIKCTLAILAEEMEREKINQTALIIIQPGLSNLSPSLLYNKDFSHQYRKGGK